MKNFVPEHKIPRKLWYTLIVISVVLMIAAFMAIKLLHWSWAWAVVCIAAIATICLILWPIGHSEKSELTGVELKLDRAKKKEAAAKAALDKSADKAAEDKLALEHAEKETAEAQADVDRKAEIKAGMLAAG